MFRKPLNVALALCTLCLTPATAQVVIYTYEGIVDLTFSPAGIWSGTQVGDAFEVVCEVDAGATATGPSNERVFENAVLSTSVTIGSATSSDSLTTSTVNVWDNWFNPNPGIPFSCMDLFTIDAFAQSDYTQLKLALRIDTGPVCHDALRTSSLPISLSLNDFGDRQFTLLVGATSGVLGTLTSVTVRPYNDDLCTGDGGNQMGCTNCPCLNSALPGTVGGCLNSVGTSTQVLASGDPSVSLASGAVHDLRFGLTGAPANSLCVLLSGDAVAPGIMINPCFGLDSGVQSLAMDGLRCAIMNTRRHGARSAGAAGEVVTDPWGGEGNPLVGIAQAGGGFVAGQTRNFQVVHRDDPLLVCQRGLNSSQAVRVLFTP